LPLWANPAYQAPTRDPTPGSRGVRFATVTMEQQSNDETVTWALPTHLAARALLTLVLIPSSDGAAIG